MNNQQRFSGEWETKRLEEIGDISGAGVDKKVNSNEVSVRLVNYLDVYNKSFLYSKDLMHEVSARPDQVRNCAVEKGDVFFTPSSEVPDDIGSSAIAMENIADGVYSYHVVRLRLKKNWDLCFRGYVFKTKEFLDEASRQCEGSGTRYVISLPKFRAMVVRFPPSIEGTTRHRQSPVRCGWVNQRITRTHRQETCNQASHHAATPHRQNAPTRLQRRMGNKAVERDCQLLGQRSYSFE